MSQYQTITVLSETIEKLRAELGELKRMMFGQKRERLPKGQMPSVAKSLRGRQGEDEQRKCERRLATKKKRAEQAALKKALPAVDVLHALDACPHCHCRELEDLKTPEESEEIELVPARPQRRRHLQQKAKCHGCGRIVTAPAPRRVDSGCLWGPRFHAHAAVAKCADSIPFYRLAKRLQRDGVPIERSTLDRLFHRTAELCEPLARRILELVVQSERINADETPLFVQAPERCRRGFMWTFVADKLIAYAFSPSRSGETPKALLGGTTGLLQVDGYTGYNAVCMPEGRQRVGCLAHARRKFFNALSTAPKDAQAALEHILSLYEVEYEAARRNILGTPQHLAMRRAITSERMEAFRAWMKEKQDVWPPKGLMGTALRYGLNTLDTLAPVLDDARVRLDNNVAEGALRLVALGRKNFLFVGDDEAGKNLAVLQTLVSTCIANDVNPEAYLADVLLRLEDTPASRIDELLPMNWKPPTTPTTSGPAP
jgi:transposase